MVVPSGPAAERRGALSGGAGGGGGGPTAVHHTTQVDISAVDAAGVHRLFENNDKALLKAIERAARKGVHLGMGRLG
jgi:hypothetical protein